MSRVYREILCIYRDNKLKEVIGYEYDEWEHHFIFIHLKYDNTETKQS